ncbi:carboxypeptidase regulatory-like domain-containing protein, partial [candidate division WOR-3 bacterium]|nr:carboxypeptidase regulatory-like domain-containing protein [candidate division WOR-3 bacterium]
AYDPATDHFWIANYDSPIYEINRSGGIINTFSNSYDIYGLAWDDISPGGPWLWVYTQDLYFARQFDPQTGTYTGLVYEGYASGEAVAGGAAFALQDGKAVFIGLTQGSPDLIFGMEVSPSSPSWIVAEPAIGTVLPGETLSIVIHLDASQATHSFYNADILIHNNSATPEISIPVTMYVPSVGGTLKGTVTDATKSPIAGALVTACNSKFYWDITDSSGRYEFYDIYPDTFDMEVTAFGYNEFDTTGVVLLPGDTTVVNISLTYPEIVVEPDNFYVTLLQDSTLDTLFYITNNGTGFLTFDIACVAGSLKAINPDIRLYQSKDMQSSLCESYNNWRPDSLSLLNGGQIIESYPSYGMPAGIEWDGTYFWQGNWDGYVVKLDSNFNYITQYQACGDLSMPPTGLTWHNGYLYQSCYTENNVYKIDVSSGYIPVDTIHVPGNGGLMGIEWIDNHLWVTDDDTELIYECDSLGNVINSWAAPDLVPYGISYNPYFNCIFLNGWSGGNIYTIDPHTGNCTFAFPTPGTGGAYSCAGSSFDNRYPTYLWITHQSDHMIYLVDTRSETWWITVDPIAGIVDPGETFEINVHFDAFIAQDTLYIGTIAIHNNSIDSLVNIPVSLRVTAVSIKESRSKIPRVFALTQNYPNPVFRNTVISYQLPKKSKVNLKVYNACGMLVKTLVNGTKEPGFYTIEWNPCDVRGRKLASGIYFYRFVSGNYKSTKKMVLIRER